MDSNYDRKFEEMKQYIPFLESMIERLENTGLSSANPRQAQLDKIRSLRDLLLDQRKRMKMDNLLKCEQVLVNLYSKVEPKDTLPGIKKASSSKGPLFPSGSAMKVQEKKAEQLNTARSKLKTVAEKSNLLVDDPDTLTEIAPASETEVICTPGSKEPALFQRRPNKASLSPQRKTQNIESSVPKRNYTRVLLSPEPSPSRWSPNDNTVNDKPLFSRRSPRKLSPTYHKKEKKKSSKQNKPVQKDLNITLNVPEESLSSLNTDDILSRIIKCPDNDVDIATLRDLRTQILGELKQTGANDDISDLILNSYKKKKKQKAYKKKEDVEEGELSDSESEAINSIYGSLVVVGKEKNNLVQAKTIANKDKSSQKIQICLVINSGKEGASKEITKKDDVEEKDFEMHDDNVITPVANTSQSCPKDVSKKTVANEAKNKKKTTLPENKVKEIITIEDEEVTKNNESVKCAIDASESKDSDSSYIDISSSDTEIVSPKPPSKKKGVEEESFKANFYKPISDQEGAEKSSPCAAYDLKSNDGPDTKLSETHKSKTDGVPQEDKDKPDKSDEPQQPKKITATQNTSPKLSSNNDVISSGSKEMDNEPQKPEDTVEIPLLDAESVQPAPRKKHVVSEIDILQALKNEILSDSIGISCADTVTPALHQPKVTKVASSQQIIRKKRISIDNYKAKSASTSKPTLFVNDPKTSKYNDNSKKQSLKLTIEERERFNFPAKLALDDSSDEDDAIDYSVEDIYKDLAPKSPENNDEVMSAAPIIIPIEPVKPTKASSKTDIDMRTTMPLSSPNTPKSVPSPSISETTLETKRPVLVDPRVKHLSTAFSIDSPNAHGTNPDRTPRNVANFQNMTPNSRSFEMTPSHPTFDFDENASRKHVYASFPYESRDYRDHSSNRDSQGSRWENNPESNSEGRNSRWDSWNDKDREGSYSRKWNDRDHRSGTDDRHKNERHRRDQSDDYSYSRLDCPRTPVHSFGRSDCPTTPLPSFGRDAPMNPFSRSDCPTTPIHPFGRSDCPSTPSHPFGRSELPMTPSHPFGRTEAPMTPNHQFGRSEMPMTPSHSFGRLDAPMTPTHPFGRTDAPMTPSHAFGRSEAPMTPSHPFGRSEAPMSSHSFGRSEIPVLSTHPFGRSEVGMAPMTPNHSFGRSDYQNHQNVGPKVVKDPRLNRSSDYDSRRYGEERDRYNDRRRSDLSSQNRYESDRIYTRDRGRDNRKHYDNNTDSRRNYQRASSQGRSNPSEDRFHRSSSRAPSVERHRSINDDKTLSVKSKSGRTFTIDTSVNTTFQEFLSGKGLQVFEYSNDSRNRRAASVGRALTRDPSTDRNVRETSVGRNLSIPARSIEEDTSGYKNMVNFVRARSMGRDLSTKTEKSFKDIKADFESYRTQNSQKDAKQNMKFTNSQRDNRRAMRESQQDKRSQLGSIKKIPYSPRKNYRDPRIRKGNLRQNDGVNRKQHGIVYSNDNIAKGAILGTGYVVKNYKIPKIKRLVVEEKQETDSNPSNQKKETAEKKSTQSNDNKITKKEVTDSGKKPDKETLRKNKKEKESKPINTYNKEKIEKKNITKPNKSEVSVKNNSIEENLVKTRKAKKVIIESDSDSENGKSKAESEVTKNEMTVPATVTNSDDSNTKNDDDSLDTSFGIDDLEIFPENVAVSGSISALIADLDNDLDSSKDSSFVKLLNDMENNEVDKKHGSELKVEESLRDISELIKKDLDKSDIKKVEISSESKSIEKDCVKRIEDDLAMPLVSKQPSQEPSDKMKADIQIETETKSDISFSKQTEVVLQSEFKVDEKTETSDVQNEQKSSEKNGTCSDAIVTTTDLNKEELSKVIEDLNEERCSTPDSTININESTLNKSRDEDLPDSTNEKSETHSDVTSTHNQTSQSSTHTDLPANDGPSSSNTSIDPFGNLLSILQDKSKLKELLSLLDSKTSENEKIKKKLEKLSEIVSDEDETNDGINDEVIEKEIEKIPETIESQPIISDSMDTIDESAKISDVVDSCTSVAKDAKAGEADETGTETIFDEDDKQLSKITKQRKVPMKRKRGKWKSDKKVVPMKNKRVTRSNAASLTVTKKQSVSRELRLLQESIKEMFISDDILNATGIRMCRLAKLVDDKNVQNEEKGENDINNTQSADSEPIVVLEKIKGKQSLEEAPKTRKKPGPKPKSKVLSNANIEKLDKKQKDTKIRPPTPTPQKYKPGPKSKKKNLPQVDSDPYSFEDSVSETTTTEQQSEQNSSDSDNDSLASFKSGSSDVLAELKKKPKRKRRPGWKSGVIKTNKRRKKLEAKPSDTSLEENVPEVEIPIVIPDMNCFTNKSYCFKKNVSDYSCRLCKYSGGDIVKHYKTEHPHTEIPLSRMSASGAQEAIEQCEDINFQAISKMSTEKYVCRFCYKEFSNKRVILEEFFWHVVSMHTGEYKQLCSECINVTRCPFNLDIPPPPKDINGQLIGYICGKCNFTQISLENLKTHVIVRHNDEQTAVYTINLSAMSKKTINALIKRCVVADQLRVLRSSRSNPSVTENSERSDRSDGVTVTTDHTSDIESVKNKSLKEEIDHLPKKSSSLKFVFENDENVIGNKPSVKVETEDADYVKEGEEHNLGESDRLSDAAAHQPTSSDILDFPHFKIHYGQAGTKEYVCCINGQNNHYKTSLLISMKRHIQTKHSEKWDGYCSVCKVIVTPQGQHNFKECLQHLLDKHLDDFPVFEENINESPEDMNTTMPLDRSSTPLSETDRSSQYINVRPLSDMISTDGSETLPKIENVMSLGVTSIEDSEVTTQRLSPNFPRQGDADQPSTFKCPTPSVKPAETCKYEEIQAEVMAKKHRVILDTMLSHEKLIQIFKCSGRYCSFTTDSAEAALMHASTHQRIGGENALMCSYCDFDCNGNAIDLVMHVFKAHGRCQYVCCHCFYRAAASQLVAAHINRMHKDAVPSLILQTETVTPGTEDTSDILPREVAVQHYTCAEANQTCKFKTYTQGKFIDHQLSKHTDGINLCYICNETARDPSDLIQHMKVHGLKLYQCTFCKDGGDNETDFLAHASARHPSKEPQAYLRIITYTKKDGVSKAMVLPLAKLNQSNLPTVLVTPPANVEHPTREANRSLDLEKIITSMPQLSYETEKEPIETVVSSPLISPKPSSSEVMSTSNAEEPVSEKTLPDRVKSPVEVQNEIAPLAPVIKTEQPDKPAEKNKVDSEIICLDSDDDVSEVTGDTRKVVDNTKKDQTTTVSDKMKRIDVHQLYKCPSCKGTFKTFTAFKKHTHKCCKGLENFPCQHCPYIVEELEELYVHYLHEHGTQDRLRNRTIQYICGICNSKEKNVAATKAHISKVHNLHKFVTTSKFGDGVLLVVSGVDPPKKAYKRKLAWGPAPDNVPKRTRFGPQDLDKLPQKPILDELTYCSECEFSTKVRLNLVRHFQQHADTQMVPHTAPVNPVPHLETNQKHFDKMMNLASSSLETARIEKPPVAVTLHIPPEAAARFPKYVPDRQRHTCGAKGCSYISLDETMLKHHWETLHAGSNDFHCVHCPPYQHLDTSKPLTASRIIGHLKMHDTRLYACSTCPYYHYRKQVLEKHLSEVHKGAGQALIVREEAASTSTPVGTTPPANAPAPTMDLKPWKCGLCTFKTMLRPEVMEHCAKTHNAKMQFKCPVCPYRASSVENVTKHQSKSHAENTEDVFYFYYREGSIPDEVDGVPRWMKQRQKINPEPEVKTELAESARPPSVTPLTPVAPVTRIDLNLDIVKKEVIDVEEELTMEELCVKFGEFCDPNGLKYKCPLCKLVTEDSKEGMQSHLFEELQYRKWGCSICSYKTFHKIRLNEHMFMEHRLRGAEPKELPVNTQVERWVAQLLLHQSTLIENNKTNLVSQNIEPERPESASIPKPIEKVQGVTLPENTNEKEINDLVQAFGTFGSPNNKHFSCPKCAYQSTDETAMRNHLEAELNKIRWRCSSCSENSQNYHEAQLHTKTCKNSLPNQPSRPVEAIRDPAMRAAWLTAVIRTQKLAMYHTTFIPETNEEELPNPLENSLLVVHYEETVPTPEEQMLSKSTVATPEEQMLSKRKRPAPTAATTSSPDSDDERLIIDEPSSDVDMDTPKKAANYVGNVKKCRYCEFSTKYPQTMEDHLLRHYKLKPVTCVHCNQTCHKNTTHNHNNYLHPHLPEKFVKTKMPSGPPLVLSILNKAKRRSRDEILRASVEKMQDKRTKEERKDMKKDDGSRLICLSCEKAVCETEVILHTHDKQKVFFAKKGDVVVKCCYCLSLFPNASSMQEHHTANHPTSQINYAYYKLHYDTREILQCGYCPKRFKFIIDLKTHNNILHSSFQLKYETIPFVPGAYDSEYDSEDKGESSKKCDANLNKMVAKKSTTKLPSQTVAKKSTTKLPSHFESDDEEYTYYGSKPTPIEDLERLTTLMSYPNSTMPVTIEKFSPVVILEDCKK